MKTVGQPERMAGERLQRSKARQSAPRQPASPTTGQSVGVPPLLLTPFSVIALQRMVGNRATAQLIASRRAHPAPGAVQRDDLSSQGKDYKVGGREQVELSFVLGEPALGIKISFKLTASRKGSKVLESPTTDVGPGEATWSLGENKVALERASGKWGAKMSSALARADWSTGLIPGFPALRFRLSGKGPEGKFDLSKGEADLDLLKVSGSIDGDFVEILDFAGLAHLKDRVSIKGSITAERGLSVRDLARLKAALRAKDEVKAAAEAATKHADDLAKHTKELENLKRQERKLTRELTAQRRELAKTQGALDRAQAQRPSRRKNARIANLERKHAKAAKALETAELRMATNRQAVKVSRTAASSSRSGLAAAGKSLAQAGRKLDGALKNVTSKLGGVARKAVEKATGQIMKKLGKTLLMRGLMKLIPGLNILSTAWDIGSILYSVFSGSRSGAPGEGGGDGGDGGSGDGGDGGDASSAGGGGQAGQGSGTGTSGGPDTGTGGTGPGKGGTGTGTGSGATGTGSGGGAGQAKVTLGPTARALADAFAGKPVDLDDEAARVLNDGIPAGITAAELPQLVERLKAQKAGDVSNPFELLAEIEAELADLRAGKPTVTFEGGPATPVTVEGADPPKTMLPGTRGDVRDALVYDPKSDQMTLKPAFAKAYPTHVFSHPDGLQVKLTAVDVESHRPARAQDWMVVKVIVKMEVVSLPPGADASYPYKVGQTGEEKMTFLYATKRKLWGEMDFSHVEQLRALLSRRGSDWVLTGAGKSVKFEHATVTVTKLVATKTVTAPDGTRTHLMAVEVVPTEITGAGAGYTAPDGWITFKLGVPVVIPFDLAEQPVAAGKP